MIFMQEQVHTMAYALQVNRFQTTVTSISSVAIMISEACLGVLGSWYRLQYPIGGGQGPRLPRCWWSPLLLQWMGVVPGDCWSGRAGGVVANLMGRNFRFCKPIPCCRSYDVFHFFWKDFRKMCVCVCWWLWRDLYVGVAGEFLLMWLQ